MKYTPPQTLDKITLARVFQEAWDAEVSQDIEASLQILTEVWNDLERDPTFEDYEPLDRAQLFRFYGYFLSNYGKSKNKRNYQERGKNLLTKSLNIFSSLNLPERALEAKIILGLCYFYEGAISESETIFEHVATQFEGRHLHPLYLRTRLNAILVLHWKGEFQKALEIVEEIKIPMEVCDDGRLLAMYHIQVGLVYRGINQYERAIYHYNKSIEVSQQENNLIVAGKSHNNLAFLYKNLGRFEQAHHHIGQALEIVTRLNHTGWIPHFLDTRTLIYLEENKYEVALETIEQAIAIFNNGEDYAVLVDALWNKVRSLLGLNREQEAIETFAELTGIASGKIGAYAVTKYAKLFAEIVHFKQQGSLEEKIRRLKRSEVVSALRQSKFSIAETAQMLVVTSKQLMNILTKEFPDVHDEMINFHNLSKHELKEVEAPEEIVVQPKHINKLSLKGIKVSIDGNLVQVEETALEFYYVSADRIKEAFALDADTLLAIIPSRQVTDGDVVLVKSDETNEYRLSRVLHDASLNIFYLMNGNEPFPLEAADIIGKAIAHCPFNDIDNHTLELKPLFAAA